MEAIQNFKNFIRHGKQAKNIYQVETASRAQRHAHSDPAPSTGDGSLHKLNSATEHAAALDGENRNSAARVNATAQHQRNDDPGLVSGGQAGIGVTAGGIIGGAGTSGKYDDIMLARIIAEEKESKGKLPKYPGLERYTLLEKMGDGAFSNVYRGRDNYGEHGEVAIKVVRKYELNASQVSSVFLFLRTKFFLLGHDKFHPHLLLIVGALSVTESSHLEICIGVRCIVVSLFLIMLHFDPPITCDPF